MASTSATAAATPGGDRRPEQHAATHRELAC
jgi:hypothetical protein